MYLLYRYREQVEGVTPPNSTTHGFFLDMEPSLGVPLRINVRFQLNILLRPDPAFPPLAKLKRPLTVQPLLWAVEGYDQLYDGKPPAKLLLVLALPRFVAAALAAVLTAAGVLIMVVALIVPDRLLCICKWRSLSPAAYAEIPLEAPSAASHNIKTTV